MGGLVVYDSPERVLCGWCGRDSKCDGGGGGGLLEDEETH